MHSWLKITQYGVFTGYEFQKHDLKHVCPFVSQFKVISQSKLSQISRRLSIKFIRSVVLAHVEMLEKLK